MVGDQSLVIHYTGRSWEYDSLAPPDATAFTALSIHGRSAQDLWASGQSGMLLHYDGQSWTPVPSGTTDFLDAVFVDQGGNVWTAGQYGTVLRRSATK